ncbi:hypothetical protein AB0392_06030 [Nonomuraea angiospora]|uniref:hypothetical protein n=1 Tax=Nonomuraea angiospora TaxID=46172 RepID=UPI00344BA43B
MTMTDTPRPVYAITDAAPPRTPAPLSPAARLVRLCCRAFVALAALLAARLLLQECPWWLPVGLLTWLVWPWLRPWLCRASAVALLVLGALDALVTACVGMPRLAYITRRFVEVVRETAREEGS